MKYVSYGIDALKEDSDLVSGIFTDKMLKDIDKIRCTKPMTAKEVEAIKRGELIERDKIITEGLADIFKKKEPYRYIEVKDVKFEKRYVEMIYNIDKDDAINKLKDQYDAAKQAYNYGSTKLFNTLFLNKEEFNTKAKSVEDLRKKVNLDMVLYYPHVPSQEKYSYYRFSWNYDNVHGKINMNTFTGHSIHLHIWLEDKKFISYRFTLERRYRSDEFNN